MGIFQQFPYTNFHEFNLDEIIKIMRQMQDEWEATKTEWASYKDFIDNYFENLDLSQEVLDNLRAMIDSGEMDPVIDPVIVTAVAAWLAEHITPTTPAIDDTLSVQGAGADAKATGDAIHEIYNAIRNAGRNLITKYTSPDTHVHHDVTFTVDENMDIDIDGTASALAWFRVYYNTAALPDGVEAGETYFYSYGRDSSSIKSNIYFYDIDGNALTEQYQPEENTFITIPAAAVGMQIRIYISANVTVSHVKAFNIGLYKYVSNRTLEKYNLSDPAHNYVGYLDTEEISKQGIKCTPHPDGTVDFSGTAAASGVVFFDTYFNRINLPEGISAGQKLHVYVQNKKWTFRIIYFTGINDTTGTSLLDVPADATHDYFLKAHEVEIPLTATGLIFRWQISATAGNAYNETGAKAVITPGDNFFDNMVDDCNNNAKGWFIGSSFLASSIWQNDSFSHLAIYENSIYGQIAMALKLKRINVKMDMYSSAGLTRSGGGNDSFIDTIMATDLTPYDYLVTHFFASDINNRALGTTASTAGDGTIAGYIKTLVNYLRTSNGLCKLVILSVPPHMADPALSGANTFTGNYSMGYSVDDLDDLMYALAKMYHFIYVSWQDWDPSYHYMDYADYTPGQTNPRHAANEDVTRVMGAFAGLQINAVNSPIATGKLLQ